MKSKGVVLGFEEAQIVKDGVVEAEKIRTIDAWLDGTDIPRLSGEQIILFLASCDNNVELAQDAIGEYYRIKSSTPQLFAERSVDSDAVRRALSAGRMCTWRDESGCAFGYYDIKVDSKSWGLADGLKLMFMAFDCALYDGPPNGLQLLIDTKEITLAIVAKCFYPDLLRTAFKYFLRASPVKLKKIHMFNTFSITRQMIQVVRPFMDKKLYEQFVFHPRDLQWEEFYEKYVPRRSLPSDLGGDLPTVDDMQQQMIDRMVELGTYYETDEKWIKGLHF
ncbi:hypothetical protein PPYR_03188 [Photinus pyralis]|uniref:CRAL-TRIO domain-containing protein n=2 Tax=Photinus pyralis TaxID=7054 RepID=A0A1Y1MID7_PHOPY|nr:uncharacterized protein LOC116161795 [Photinus pyralis]KAB0791388.1 hypothetical protein PPYR_03188 [Photinus pyralis]